MDGCPNRRNKGAFLNSYSVVWTYPDLELRAGVGVEGEFICLPCRLLSLLRFLFFPGPPPLDPPLLGAYHCFHCTPSIPSYFY